MRYDVPRIYSTPAIKMKNTPTIIFLNVADNATKLKKLCETVRGHFSAKEKILIAVSSDEAASYIDQLLWRMPEESFMPHITSEKKSNEHIVITKSNENINGANVYINLRAEIPASMTGYHLIYDLLDLTHPTKADQSRKRQDAYQTSGYTFTEI